MTTVGFIGLGIMGRPMAANLRAAGHIVTGFSRGEVSREAARDSAIPLADSISDAVRDAELVITVLPDSPDVEAVALGPGGILENLPAGASYIDMSSIKPDTARDVARRFLESGHGVLDAPVSGGESGAIAGTLSIMVGGPGTEVERWRDVLGAMGSSVVHVGESGSGQVVKAANQLVVATHIQALAEVVVFLEGQGVDVRTALAAVAKGLGGSTVIDRKTDSVLAGTFEPGFRIELHNKDLGIVHESARAAGTSLPVTALVTQFVQSIVAQGDGQLDHSALVRFARSLNTEERR